MKIIFDSEEQMSYLTGNHCPCDVNCDVEDFSWRGKCIDNCEECWGRNIEMEVKQND